MKATNVEVVKNQNETNITLVRRFTKRMQGSGVLRHIRKRKFFTRTSSELKKKNRALKRIVRQKETERLRKLGKIK